MSLYGAYRNFALGPAAVTSTHPQLAALSRTPATAGVVLVLVFQRCDGLRDYGCSRSSSAC